MATKFKRSITAHCEALEQWNGGRTTRWVKPPEGSSVMEIQTTHNPSQFKDVPISKNYLIPPWHWHWYQDENFDITQGHVKATMRFIFNFEGKETVHDASSGRITIPAKARHTFRVDPTSPEPCTIHISLSATRGGDEVFFRNIYSYLDDCGKQNIQPSLPQLLLFLDYAQISLAFPGPALLMRWLSWGMGVVIGRWWGQYVLGLKVSYPEYYDEKMANRG